MSVVYFGSLLLAFLGRLLFTAALIAALLLWLTYMPLPAVVKAVLFAALALAIIAAVSVYARRQRQSRRQAAQRKTVIETLDFSDEMMEVFELPRLSPEQRDVLRGAFDALLENWPRQAGR